MRLDYGSEGWGFESLRAHQQPLNSAKPGGNDKGTATWKDGSDLRQQLESQRMAV